MIARSIGSGLAASALADASPVFLVDLLGLPERGALATLEGGGETTIALAIQVCQSAS
jgi:hypothetical protein